MQPASRRPNFIKLGLLLLRYGDLTIFKMAAVRYLENLEFSLEFRPMSQNLYCHAIQLPYAKFHWNRRTTAELWKTCDDPRMIFSMRQPPSGILKMLIFGHVTVIEYYCIPNFSKIVTRFRPPDAHNCQMFNARFLGNCRYHGNRIMAGMLGRRWDATTQVSSKSVHW